MYCCLTAANAASLDEPQQAVDPFDELFAQDPFAPYLEWLLGVQVVSTVLAATCFLVFVVLIVGWTRVPGRYIFAAGNVLVVTISLWEYLWNFRQLRIVGITEGLMIRGGVALGMAIAGIGAVIIAVSLVRQRRVTIDAELAANASPERTRDR